ncbi:DUF1641 domain-containing protein [Hazenella coriacea]|uniref:Uncharacterized protein YjgD (DUF1641 family) n=1 Tax=Hazenella coriacea TaxID=1179467 RepID=A0A4V2UV37_9BACL|nr:DUF1641 domain-containing protein [Hazenella coriacea]TCS94197.1 uncharacterized protein YjgD (DUF1641 family) [Hazenella coriacea]
MAETKKHLALDVIPEETQERVVEMLPVFLDTLSIIKMMSDTLTDETVNGLTQKLEQSSQLLDVLGDERVHHLIDVLLKHSDQLAHVLEKVMVLEKNGTLDKLLELAQTLGVLTDSLTESTVQHLTQQGLQLVEVGDQVLKSSLVKEAPKLIDAVEKTIEQKKDQPVTQNLSLFQLLKLTKEKEIQEAILFGVTLLKNLRSVK